MDETKPYQISEYIEVLNTRIHGLYVDIIGEVSEMKLAASGHVYFTLKDKETGDVFPCAVWKSRYEGSGVDLEIGMEVLARGRASFTGRFGKMSFIADSIALVGEWALKKAYDKLKKKLQSEGLFEVSRKRPLPAFPRKIGVITSVHGAVIHDFSNNLRKSGFEVKILDCRVEGPESGRLLRLSVRAMRNEDIDVLVLIRGGGSMQSLAGFDNEALVREVAAFPVPVIAGVGHHEDVTLAALVADAAESTPSLVAALLGRSWDQAQQNLERIERSIFSLYAGRLENVSWQLSSVYEKAHDSFGQILERYKRAERAVHIGLTKIESQLWSLRRTIAQAQSSVIRRFGNALFVTEKAYFTEAPQMLIRKYSSALRATATVITNLSRVVELNNPERQLGLGYSIVFSEGKVLRSVKDARVDTALSVQMSDGTIQTTITGTTKNHG
jgi:exodeoxyribonuclease VII large subunit